MTLFVFGVGEQATTVESQAGKDGTAIAVLRMTAKTYNGKTQQSKSKS
jgi:hypothetical protein